MKRVSHTVRQLRLVPDTKYGVGIIADDSEAQLPAAASVPMRVGTPSDGSTRTFHAIPSGSLGSIPEIECAALLAMHTFPHDPRRTSRIAAPSASRQEAAGAASRSTLHASRIPSDRAAKKDDDGDAEENAAGATVQQTYSDPRPSQ